MFLTKHIGIAVYFKEQTVLIPEIINQNLLKFIDFDVLKKW